MLSFALQCTLLRALNFQSGACSCLNPSDALPAASPGVAFHLRERFWGVCVVPADGAAGALCTQQAPNSPPDRRDLAVGFRVLLWPCFIFLWGTFAKCTPTFSSSFCLLPPPTSEDFGSRLVRFVPISSSHPGETSPAAQSSSSGEPGEGSWENYRKIK